MRKKNRYTSGVHFGLTSDNGHGAIEHEYYFKKKSSSSCRNTCVHFVMIFLRDCTSTFV